MQSSLVFMCTCQIYLFLSFCVTYLPTLDITAETISERVCQLRAEKRI